MIWNPLIAQIAAWLATFGITGVAAAGMAYWLFKQLASGWLKARFDRDLEEFKASKNQELEGLKNAYQQEVERLKGDINRLLDRAVKLHQREYEVLPEAWGLLNKAYGAASHLVMSLQRSPDLDQMSTDRLNEFLEKSELSEIQKSEIRTSNDKNSEYLKMDFWIKYSQARKAVTEYQNYTILMGIFIEPLLEAKMRQASHAVQMALIHREQAEQGTQLGWPTTSDSWSKTHEEIGKAEPLIAEIKREVQGRLWDVHLPDQAKDQIP